MEKKASLDKVYKPSEDIVARDVQGEFVIIPVTSGIGDSDEDIFSLNETGLAIWKRLDGKNTLEKIKAEIAKDYKIPEEEIEKDILGIVEELLNKKMLAEAVK